MHIMHIPVIVESHMLGSEGLILFVALEASKIKLVLFVSQRWFMSRINLMVAVNVVIRNLPLFI